MNGDVLVVAVSPEGKYIAVALIDNTVKVGWTILFLLFLHVLYVALIIEYQDHIQFKFLLLCG